jgi:hypothetical protein
MSVLKQIAWCWVAVAFSALGTHTADAQPTPLFQTWVASNGNDVVGCGGLNAPCATLNFAVGVTAAGGEIQCKDVMTMNGGLTINKSLSVTCDVGRSNSKNSLVLGNLTISIAPSDLVTLRGFTVDGASSAEGISGILFNGAGTLILDNVKISGWKESGLFFRPSGPAKLLVSNSLFARNGAEPTGAGIRVFPVMGASAQVSITHSDFVGNVFGLAIDGTAVPVASMR